MTEIGRCDAFVYKNKLLNRHMILMFYLEDSDTQNEQINKVFAHISPLKQNAIRLGIDIYTLRFLHDFFQTVSNFRVRYVIS